MRLAARTGAIATASVAAMSLRTPCAGARCGRRPLQRQRPQLLPLEARSAWQAAAQQPGTGKRKGDSAPPERTGCKSRV